ncbi:MAG: hypothetical protein JWO81_3194 [Alphaproteobacteria bacterium]|nr:hypothetical protein [Alphaproteobacteria bacterium]
MDDRKAPRSDSTQRGVFRRNWQTPHVRRLDAGAAENGLSTNVADGQFTQS